MASLVAISMAALAFILIDTAHAQNDFYDAKIDSEWMDATLYCSNTTSPLPINDTNPVSWMLPNLTVLYFSTHKYIIGNDNWTLVIRNATTNDLGYYHCLLPVSGGSNYYLVKLGLNARGPYFEDLWEKYTMNTIIGLSVAGGFAILCVLLYLLDRFRYREPTEPDRKLEADGKLGSVMYENTGFAEVVELGYFNRPTQEMENGLKKRDLGEENPVIDAFYEEEYGIQL